MKFDSPSSVTLLDAQSTGDLILTLSTQAEGNAFSAMIILAERGRLGVPVQGVERWRIQLAPVI